MTAPSLSQTADGGLAPMQAASGRGMRKSGVELRKVGVLDPHVFGLRVAEFLRSVHPQKTATCVEAETGVAAKTVSKWLEGASAPSGVAYHRLIKVYPDLPYFVTPERSPALLREMARAAQQARLERAAAANHQRLAELWGEP